MNFHPLRFLLNVNTIDILRYLWEEVYIKSSKTNCMPLIKCQFFCTNISHMRALWRGHFPSSCKSMSDHQSQGIFLYVMFYSCHSLILTIRAKICWQKASVQFGQTLHKKLYTIYKNWLFTLYKNQSIVACCVYLDSCFKRSLRAQNFAASNA
jgi:hypothetical protein